MKILVVNDDGVSSPGLIALASALRALGEVTVVAPDRDRSGVGHSISIAHPIEITRVEGRDVPTYACSGTPADCVVLGAFEFCDGAPDLVVSGINRGANLADDISYSGTVAAAVEGVLLGANAIAVSLAATWPESSPTHYWDVAAAIACEQADAIQRVSLEPGVFLNINVPNVAPHALRGIKYTRQGRKRYSDRVSKSIDEGRVLYAWVWGTHDARENGPDCDIIAVDDGYASITPLRVDRTADVTLARLRAESPRKTRTLPEK